MKGTLYGVGIGAGDPQFLTYQAAECIKKCNSSKCKNQMNIVKKDSNCYLSILL